MQGTKLKLIGKGTFTKAYLQPDGKVLVKSPCPVKEILSLGWCGNARFLPKIERIDHEEYIMPLYEKPRKLKEALLPVEYKFYLALREMHSNCWGKGLFGIIDAIKNSKLSPQRKKQMIEFAEGVANIGVEDIRFEISPRNVAVKNGKLILLDVFFSSSKLRSTRKR